MHAPAPSVFYLQKVETTPVGGLGEDSFFFASNDAGQEHT